MPLLIVLKNPRMNLIADDELKDGDEGRWDEIFHNQVLIVKNMSGRNTLIPLLQECNIAVIEEVTDDEIKKMKKEAEERKKQMEAQGGMGGGRGPGGLITKPEYVFPVGRGGRS